MFEEREGKNKGGGANLCKIRIGNFISLPKMHKTFEIADIFV